MLTTAPRPSAAGDDSHPAGASGLLLLRHGESTWNAAGRWQGQADPPLAESGIEAVRRLVGELAPYGFGFVAASPLARAARTAEMLAHGLGLEAPQLDARLMERHVEAWSGLTDAEIEARWPGQPAAWRAADSLAPPCGGEDQASVARRVTACLVELRAAHAQRRLLVVTHGGAIRALDRAAGGSGEPLANLGGRWFEPSAGGLRCTGVFAPRGTPPRRPPASEPRSEPRL